MTASYASKIDLLGAPPLRPGLPRPAPRPPRAADLVHGDSGDGGSDDLEGGGYDSDGTLDRQSVCTDQVRLYVL